LEEESSAFFSTSRLWDDGVILPQDTRKVKENRKKILCGLGHAFFTVTNKRPKSTGMIPDFSLDVLND